MRTAQLVIREKRLVFGSFFPKFAGIVILLVFVLRNVEIDVVIRRLPALYLIAQLRAVG